MRTTSGERRVIQTVEALDTAMAESTVAIGIYLYINERLLDEARQRWGAMKRRRNG